MLPRSRPLALLPVLAAFVAGASPALAQGTQPSGSGDSSTTAPSDGSTTDPPKKPKKPAAPKKPKKKDEPKAEEPKKDEEKKEEPKAEEPKPAASQELAGEPGARERGFQFSFGAGFTRQDVGAFSDSLSFDKTGANGVLLELGLGVRFTQLRAGIRLRAADTTEFTLWQAMLEGGYGFVIPKLPVVPVVLGHVGYTFKRDIEDAVIRSQLPAGTALTPQFGVDGLILGVDVAADYHASSYFHISPFITGDVLFVGRGRAAVPRTVFGNPTPEETARPLYNESGSGIGYGFNAGLRGLFDVGF
ncbi:MAG: hypothetical protein R3B36_11825 [Polyangiaceae bacterium]